MNQRDDKQHDWADLVSVLEQDEDRRDALAVLGVLFPAVRDKNPSRVRPGRFAHPDYFDRYLAQAIPEGDIPDSFISHALDRGAAGDDYDLRSLLTGEDTDRVMLAISKVRARYPDVGETRYHEGLTGPVTADLLSVAMALVGEADDRLTSLTSSLDQMLDWAATLLRRLLDAHPALEVDPALLRCTKIHRRAHVLTTATRDFNGLSEESHKALNLALQREIGRILPMLLDDLRKGDDSIGESGSTFLYELVAESTLVGELQTQIQEGLAAKEFTLEDVAARFVGLSYVIGGSGHPSAGSFSGSLFTKVTGIEACSADHMETGGWPNTGWPRRREFAAQFITPTDSTEESVGHNDPEAPR